MQLKNKLLITLFFLNISDVVLTVLGLQIGLAEANPLVKINLLSIGIKLVLPFVLIGIVELTAYLYPKTVTVLNLVLCYITIFYIYVTVHNSILILSQVFQIL